MLGRGDALRGAGNYEAVLMLHPGCREFQTPATGLFRVIVGKRVCRLEKRVHATPTGRCSRGRWERLQSCETPKRAREWGKLARFWRWYALEVSSGIDPFYSWEDDNGKNFNLCHTRSDRDAPSPRVGGSPHRAKNSPTRVEAFGYAPSSGVRLCQTHADRRAEARNRSRMHRAQRRD